MRASGSRLELDAAGDRVNLDAAAGIADSRAQAVPVLILDYDGDSGLDIARRRLGGKMETRGRRNRHLYAA